MDRREIQHIEPHGTNCRQARDHIGERAVPRRIIRGGAGKHFIPARKAGLRAICIEAHRRSMFGGKRPVVERMHRRGRVIGQQQRDLCRGVQRLQSFGDRRQYTALACRRAGDRRLDHAEPLLDFQRHGLAGGVFGGQIVAEGSPRIPPCLHGEPMPTGSRRHEARFPAIVRRRPGLHRDTMPVRFIVRGPQQLGRQHVVAIGNDVGADRDAVTDQPFHRKRTIGDLRKNRLDGDPRGGQTGLMKFLVADNRMDHRSRRRIGENPHLARSPSAHPHLRASPPMPRPRRPAAAAAKPTARPARCGRYRDWPAPSPRVTRCAGPAHRTAAVP